MLTGASEKSFFYEARVWASSDADALRRFETMLANGPGHRLASSDRMDAFLETEATEDGFVITSSLSEEFATFTLNLDGNLVADVASGLNANVERIGAGWTRITTILPIAVISPAEVLTLYQKGTADLAATVNIEVELAP